MIPLAAIPWRLIGYGAAVAALLLLGWRVHAWREGYKALGAVRQEMVELKVAQAASQKASEGYQNELAEIRNRPVPVEPVRLCIKRPAVPAAGSGSGATVPATGVLPGADGSDYQEGPDIAADLLRLADEADEVTARGRATQSLHLRAK